MALIRVHEFSEDALAAAFTTWETDYRDNPYGYADEHGEPLAYGKACARHLIRILSGDL